MSNPGATSCASTNKVLDSIATRISVLLAMERIIEDARSNLDPLGMALEGAALAGAKAERKFLEDAAFGLRRKVQLEEQGSAR